MDNYVLMALLATLGTWLLTALGAGTVIFCKSANHKLMNLMYGFAAGVMIAASFWSLLQPAIDQAEQNSKIPSYIVVTIGFILGAVLVAVYFKLKIKRIQKDCETRISEARTTLDRVLEIATK
jgi:ZIP family zinc transporter